jgi:two-component system response regulator MprA
MTVDGSLPKPPLVYLVEDEPEIATTLSNVLRYGGCQVRTFLSGGDLLAYQSDSPPDVVVTDYVMQPMDGVRLAGWVRSTWPQARVIMITGDEHLARSAAGYALPYTVMEKPLDSVKLIARVHGIDLDEAENCA